MSGIRQYFQKKYAVAIGFGALGVSILAFAFQKKHGTESESVSLLQSARSKKSEPEEVPLFHQLGGQGKCTQIAEILVNKLITNQELSQRFKVHNPDSIRIIENMSDYISKVLGGKVKYSGKPIHETHKRIGVNEFDITKLFDYFEEESSTIEISKSLAEQVRKKLEKKFKEQVFG